MWNIKHSGHAILKRQNKIKIIYKHWQFLLFFFLKSCCLSLAPNYWHLPCGPCSKPLGETLRRGGLRFISLFRQLRVHPFPLHPLLRPHSWMSAKRVLTLKIGWPRFWRQNDEVHSWKNNSNKRCDSILLEPVLQCQRSLLTLGSLLTEDFSNSVVLAQWHQHYLGTHWKMEIFQVPSQTYWFRVRPRHLRFLIWLHIQLWESRFYFLAQFVLTILPHWSPE